MSLKKDKEILNNINFSGVMPSPKDDRDYTTKKVLAMAVQIPEEYQAPSTNILDQGSVGSCVAHASATTLMANEFTNLQIYNNYSRGYIYANRASSDYQGSGMYIRQALKQLNKCGDVLYDDFPYNVEWPQIRDILEQCGIEKLATLAKEHKITNYYRCYSEDEIKQTILTRGAVIICVPVYTDFARDIKKTKTNKLRGYHAMAIIGWTKDYWIVQNSWGKTWGYNGLAHMDFDYPVDEFWGITFDGNQEKPKRKSWILRILEWFVNLFTKKR